MFKTDNFPTLQERENLTTLKKYQRLYDNEQFAVLGLHDLIKKQYKDEKNIVYISHPIPSRISDFYGDFVAGDSDRMLFIAPDKDKKIQEVIDEIVYESDLKEKVADFATTQSIAGYTVLYAWVDDQNIGHIDEIMPDQYFPQSDGSVVIATYKLDPDDKMGKKLLLYTQYFYLEGGVLKIKRQAFSTDEKGVITHEITLEKMGEILGRTLEAETTISELDEMPFRKVKNNKKAQSDYAPIIPQLAEINERVTQNSTQFLKNIDAKMQLPASMVNAEGKVEAFDYILVDNKEQPQAGYITNSNPLMNDAREHIMHELKTIEMVTGVPMWSLTKSSAMPERVESLRIQLFQSIRKTNGKRSKLKRAMQDLFRIIFKMKGLDTNNDVYIKFSDVLPVDETAQANVEVAKTQSGLSSRKSSMMRIEGYTEEEADAELKRIAEEDAVSGVNFVPPTM